jgi:hypothetical protein
MLSTEVKKRIARNRLLRAKPNWVQKAEMYVHNEKTYLRMNSQVLLSTKHILDPASQMDAAAQNNVRAAELRQLCEGLDVWLAQVTRQQWQELEPNLTIEARWTPIQMQRTVRACGGFHRVIEAHGGYRQARAKSPQRPAGAPVPTMGNWDNPATDDAWMHDGNQWEAEHGDPQ